MKIGKIELTQKKLIIIVIAVFTGLAISVYVIVYAPLLTNIKTKYVACRQAENDVLECRNIIESAGRVYGERILSGEEDTSRAIDELTRYGKSKGINFVSMSPQKIQKKNGTEYKILPVTMQIESTFKTLGIFMGSLDDLEKSLVRIKSFDINPDKDKPKVLITDLVVDIYLSGK